MAFNTTSYLAGVGSVVVILSTGFAGGYMLANPTHQDPPNRLQRLAAEGQDAKPVAQATTKPEAVATVAQASTPAPATPQPAAADPPAQPASVPAAAKAAEPVRSVAQVNAEKANAVKSGTEKARMAEAKAAEKKRAETRKFAERQRKQRELEVATVAVRRMMHDRDNEAFAAMDQPEPPPPEMPRLSLFGQ